MTDDLLANAHKPKSRFIVPNDAPAFGRINRTYVDRVAPAVSAASIPLRVTAWEVPGEPVPFAEVCAGCGWHEGQYLEDEDQAWDRWREDRLGRGLELWEGEDG